MRFAGVSEASKVSGPNGGRPRIRSEALSAIMTTAVVEPLCDISHPSPLFHDTRLFRIGVRSYLLNIEVVSAGRPVGAYLSYRSRDGACSDRQCAGSSRGHLYAMNSGRPGHGRRGPSGDDDRTVHMNLVRRRQNLRSKGTPM